MGCAFRSEERRPKLERQRQQEGGVYSDFGMLGCVNQRNGPGFAPVRLRTRKDCGWFFDERQWQWQHEAEAMGDDHDN